MMAKRYDQLDKLKQITKLMEDHNILKLKTDEFQIERGRPEDAVDLAQRKEMDEKEKEEVKRLAAIRLHCPFPCPHWPPELSTAEQKVG
jgi:hypothetical protein